jgi:hypothetical protein
VSPCETTRSTRLVSRFPVTKAAPAPARRKRLQHRDDEPGALREDAAPGRQGDPRGGQRDHEGEPNLLIGVFTTVDVLGDLADGASAQHLVAEIAVAAALAPPGAGG